MHRIQGENVDTSEGKNLFRTEAPYTTQTPEWANSIQEEIMNIVDEAGLETLFSDNDTRNQLLKALKILFMPVGSIQAFAGNTAPSGYLDCDGSAVSRTTYIDLFNTIGTTWGIGDGTTTFNLPDLRGAFLRGTGSHGSETMADGNPFAGPSLGSYENDQMQGHWHDYIEWETASILGGSTDKIMEDPHGSLPSVNNLIRDPITDGVHGTPRSDDETRPFAAGIKYIIKY